MGRGKFNWGGVSFYTFFNREEKKLKMYYLLGGRLINQWKFCYTGSFTAKARRR
jgi:hypothetical protein